MKFVLMGNHSPAWIAQPRARGAQAYAKCLELGLRVDASYYVQGRYDFVTIIDAPSSELASHFSLWYSAKGFGSVEPVRGYEPEEINLIADQIHASMQADATTGTADLDLASSLGSPVFEHHDQDSLDREYNPRLTSPDFASVIGRWEAKSTTAMASIEHQVDLAYGDSPTETLDFFPAPEPGRPFHIFFHGGYWRSQDKNSQSFLANTFVKAGYNLVIPNYALCPTVTMDTLLGQCMRAIRWVSQNAGALNGVPAIHLAGHSAGAHIIAMALTGTDRFGLQGIDIRSATALSGLYNLEPLRRSFLNVEILLDQASVKRNSPIGLVQASRVPFLLALGANESHEFHRQTTSFDAAWRQAGNESTVFEVEGCDHYSALDTLGDPSSAFAARVVAHMGLAQERAR